MFLSQVFGKFERKETLYLFGLLFLSVFLRFSGLGFSDFYGDETKTFYLDKTVSAKEFFLNQRKGPLQFFIVWGVEKITGGFSEFTTRLPFAIAGLLTVFAFYLLVRELFNRKTALFSSFLFSISGFNIAFSRTIQYQSLLTLFGIFGLYLFIRSIKLNSRPLLFMSSISFVLSFFAHYDAVFFVFPTLYFLVTRSVSPKRFITTFLLPLLLLVGSFYIPYILGGYFSSHTQGYLQRRLSGSGFSTNNSLYTFFVYNPSAIYYALLTFAGVVIITKRRNKHVQFLLVWFLLPFVILELVISNPGTHIHTYFIPLYILAGCGANVFKPGRLIAGVLLIGAACVSCMTYVPTLSLGHPWNSGINQKYHLFLYGFPYNRGWRQIRSYFVEKEGVRGVYTNDNDTIAEYYLKGFSYTPPGANFLPQYYIHVYGNQEFVEKPIKFPENFLSSYMKETDFYVNEKLVAEVYKLITR